MRTMRWTARRSNWAPPPPMLLLLPMLLWLLVCVTCVPLRVCGEWSSPAIGASDLQGNSPFLLSPLSTVVASITSPDGTVLPSTLPLANDSRWLAPDAVLVSLPFNPMAPTGALYAYLLIGAVEIALTYAPMPSACASAVRFSNGSVLLSGIGLGVHMLPGPYAALSNGPAHLCMLSLAGNVTCVANDETAADQGALMKTKSHVLYSQIACGSVFTCAIRRADARVECNSATPGFFLNSSAHAYSAISAQWGSGFCGLSINATGLWCWSAALGERRVLPAPLTGFFTRPLITTGGALFDDLYACALLNTGRVNCSVGLDVFKFPREAPFNSHALSSLVQSGHKLIGVAADTSQLLSYRTTPNLFSSFEFATQSQKWIVVDPSAGNDTLCNSVVVASTPSALHALVACRSLAGAIAAIPEPNVWITIMAGTYLEGGLQVNYAGVSFSPLLPSTLNDADLQRAALLSPLLAQLQLASSTLAPVVWNCTGFTNCLTSTYPSMSFSHLLFTGSREHAIVHGSRPEIATLSDLVITACNFSDIGGALHKTNGRAVIRGVILTRAITNTTVSALIQLQEASIDLSQSSCVGNNMSFVSAGALYPLAPSCLSSSNKLLITVRIDSCVFRNNFVRFVNADSDYTSLESAGGISLRIYTSNIDMTVTRSVFEDQTLICNQCVGGAVSFHTDTAAAGSAMDVHFSDCVWTRNVVKPWPSYSAIGGSGACLAVTQAITAVLFQSAIALVVQNCSFSSSIAGARGGAVSLGLVKSVLFDHVTIENCTANSGGGINFAELLEEGEAQLLQGPMLFANVTFTDNSATIDGGAMVIDSIGTVVTLEDCRFDRHTAVDGGTLAFKSLFVPTVSQMTNCVLTNSAAQRGGAMFMSAAIISLNRVEFKNTSASNDGGAISASITTLSLDSCSFTDSHLTIIPASVLSKIPQTRAGGAINAVSGVLTVVTTTFSSCTALPESGLLSDCEHLYVPSTGQCTASLGGAIALELVEFRLLDASFERTRACSGGALWQRGGTSGIEGVTTVSTDAWSGGMAAILGVQDDVAMSFVSVTDSRAVAAGGSFVFTSCSSMYVNSATIRNSSAGGDGGTFWESGSVLVVTNSNFIDSVCSGAGAVLFAQSSAADVPLFVDNPASHNTVSLDKARPPVSLFGPVQASNVQTLRCNLAALSIYPGQSLAADPATPIVVESIDAYNQTMLMDRALIVQVDYRLAMVFPTRPAFDIDGTVLKKVAAANGAATFDDLRLSATPGEYTLVFSLVSLPSLAVTMNLTVVPTCPGGQFFVPSAGQCSTCPAGFLVYNTTTQTCLPCPRGSSVSPITGVCELCPLGTYSSTEGANCGACPPSTYQPVPGAQCASCLEKHMVGVTCVSADSLAAVSPGYFAYSSLDENGQPTIATVQCPEGFCDGAPLQLNWTDRGAGSEPAGPVSRFDQCAYPRLASPSNLLCGECAEGYVPWGQNCARCEGTNVGMMFGLIVLSLVVVALLIRASVIASSAGHAVVILYFVQTAMLELGGSSELLSWLGIALFSPNSIQTCLMKMSPYQQTQAQIVMPLLLEVELLVVGLLHYIAWRKVGAQARAIVKGPKPKGWSLRLQRLVWKFISLFSVDVYISATLSLLSFTYTQVAIASVSYLNCVEVAGDSVVFSQPAMHCRSAEYERTLVLVMLALIVYIAGFPVGVLLFLWRRSADVRECHALLAANGLTVDTGLKSDDESLDARGSISPGPLSPSSTSADFTAPSPSAAKSQRVQDILVFLRRYGPIFSMYSSSAWVWQVFVLARRVAFVAISVALARNAAERAFAFTLGHLLSMLIQIHVAPFRATFFNRAELSSHVLLIVISLVLLLRVPPLSSTTSFFLFCLVVPPLGLYALIASGRKARSLTGKRKPADRLHDATKAEDDDSAIDPAAVGQVQLPGRQVARVSVELGSVGFFSTAKSPQSHARSHLFEDDAAGDASLRSPSQGSGSVSQRPAGMSSSLAPNRPSAASSASSAPLPIPATIDESTSPSAASSLHSPLEPRSMRSDDDTSGQQQQQQQPQPPPHFPPPPIVDSDSLDLNPLHAPHSPPSPPHPQQAL